MKKRDSRDVLTAILFFLIVCWIVLMVISPAKAETRWVMCKSYVNVRETPGSKTGGRLDAGDDFETEGKARDGYIKALGIGEAGTGWVFKGYTVTEKPVQVNERFVCVARSRVACRRWVDGPRIKGKTGWLYNGTNVKVYWRTSEWSLTSRGYIRSEWLEADPE